MIPFQFSCNKSSEIVNPNVLVIGHGGSGFQSIYPINSIESVINALEKKVDGIEIDIQFSQDEVMVCFHDIDLSDSSNLEGKIYTRDWDYIKNGEYKYAIHAGYKIASLEQIFTAIQPYTDKKIYLDCKTAFPDRSPAKIDIFNNNLIALIDQFGYRDRVVVELKFESFIYGFKEKAPDIPIFFFNTFSKVQALTDSIEIFGWIGEMDEVTPEQQQEAADRNLCTMVFDVQTNKENKEALSKGFCAIQTEKLDFLIRKLGR